MQCRKCHQELSPAEVLKHEEHDREFEDFEHALRACSPDENELEDVEIPDHAPPDVDGITMLEDGTITYPAAWLLPLCDRCHVLDCIEIVFYDWDGRLAYPLMRAYADGTHGCPRSLVMAVSWAMVVQQWYEDTEERDESDEYTEAVQVQGTLGLSLSAIELDAAIAMAEDVFDIARACGAIWVPDPNPEYLAIFQRAFER